MYCIFQIFVSAYITVLLNHSQAARFDYSISYQDHISGFNLGYDFK